MSNYNKLHRCRALIHSAELQMKEARDQIDGLNPDGGIPAVISPTRFEHAYRGLARSAGRGHDYYDQWTADGQRTCRNQARAVLEAAGFTVQERDT